MIHVLILTFLFIGWQEWLAREGPVLLQATTAWLASPRTNLALAARHLWQAVIVAGVCTSMCFLDRVPTPTAHPPQHMLSVRH